MWFEKQEPWQDDMPWIALGIGLLILGVGVTVKNTMPDKDFFKFDNLFKNAGNKYGVPWKWIKAVAMNESSLGNHPSVKRGIENPTDVNGSKSSDGLSWGLMQVTIRTARSLDPKTTEVKLNDPIYSVDLGARYLRDLQNSFDQKNPKFMEYVIKSYNQGPGNTRKEIATGKGYADDYFKRFLRNLEKINSIQA